MLTRSDVLLSGLTTLRVGGPARAFLEVGERAELYDAVAAADGAADPVLVLGAGSNLVVADAGFPGTTIAVRTAGEAATSVGDSVEVTVEAGEDWDGLVSRAVDRGWSGLEALSGIPGTVGAAPVQNVGAYGREVSETVVAVHAYDRRAGRPTVLDSVACGFGYRTSVFKAAPGHYAIGAVTFRLAVHPTAEVRYADIAARLGVPVGAQVPLVELRSAVLGVRATKGMLLDPADHDTWSVGSFFTNPFLAPDRVPAGAPAWPQSTGSVKTSAAWLIEHAGFGRGHGNDRVRLSTKHPLAVTNRGGATTADVLALARSVRDGVAARFGVELKPEPTLVGCRL
ncbi:MAG TPA: UDP-N-acetylmuramate dehydrogenase [Nocardioidaceae bacterium]|nr:UDP-N-acetylmuramate dehydrogenase [Nocardioidaceae bacterium]